MAVVVALGSFAACSFKKNLPESTSHEAAPAVAAPVAVPAAPETAPVPVAVPESMPTAPVHP